MEWFDSILFVLSIRGIFDSVTSRDHAMKFWKLIRSKGWSFTIKIPFHAKVLDPDCFSKRNLMKFSNVRRVNLQIDQFGSRLARIIGRSCVRHSIDAWFRVIPRKEGSEFSSKIDGNDLEKEFCTVISRTTPFRQKPFISAHTCSGLITDTGSSLSPRVSMSQILFYPRFPIRIEFFSPPLCLHAPSFVTIL